MKKGSFFKILPLSIVGLLLFAFQSIASEPTLTKVNISKLPSSAKVDKSKTIKMINSAIKTSDLIGDGSHFVSTGDTVRLDNNVQIKIHTIRKTNSTSRYSKNDLELFASFSLNGSMLSIFPVRIKIYATPQNISWKGYLFGGYGTQIALPSDNQDTEIETIFAPLEKFKLKFTSNNNLGVINSPSQLYDFCMTNLQEQYNKNQCFMFTPYEPVSGEAKKADNSISVIGPPNLLETYFNEAKKCHERLSTLIGIKQGAPVMPIRIVSDITTLISSSDFGILLPPSLETGNTDQCNPAMLHEMSHFAIAPAPLRNIFNEGLATYITSLSPQVGTLTTISDNYILDENWHAAPSSSASIGFKIESIDQTNSTVVIGYGLNISGTWTKVNKQDLVIGIGEAVVLYYDPYFPVIELKEITGQSAVFSIYEHLAPQKNSSTFICEENGFRDMLGWKTAAGKIVKAAGSINPTIPFAKLDTYLNGGTSTANDYYKTSACLWEKIDKAVGIKKTVDEMRKWQNFKNESFDFLNFLSTNGMDVNSLAQTFGFSTDDQETNSYPMFLIGQYFVI